MPDGAALETGIWPLGSTLFEPHQPRQRASHRVVPTMTRPLVCCHGRPMRTEPLRCRFATAAEDLPKSLCDSIAEFLTVLQILELNFQSL